MATRESKQSGGNSNNYKQIAERPKEGTVSVNLWFQNQEHHLKLVRNANFTAPLQT